MTRSQSLGSASDTFREFARRRAAEAVGLATLGACGALTAALVTWSARDPSLNHATDGRVHNLLGAPGAIVADLFMQLFGVATIAAILPVAAIGMRLLTHRGVERSGLRFMLWIVGVLSAAVTASLLPVTDRWPLPTGLGGVVGDAVLALPRHLAGGARIAVAITGLLSIVGAILALTGAAGYGFESESDLRLDSEEEQSRPLQRPAKEDDDEDAAGEPGVAIVSVGAALHAVLTVKAFLRRSFEKLRSARRIAAGPTPDQQDHLSPSNAGLHERREPIFGDLNDFDADEPPARPRTAARADASVPPSRLVVSPPGQVVPAAAATGGKQVIRERAAAPAGKGAPSRPYRLPELELLAEPKKPSAGAKISQDALEQNARNLEGVLDDFSVRGEIINVRPGPVVTLYELEPAPGIKSSRVIGLADDIARSMSAVSARVAVVPGRNAIGIELPNQRRETVYLRELLACEDFATSKHKLAIALGKTIGGEPVIVDLARMPHLLVAGTTGSGKSVAINTMILSLLYRLKPEECRLIMVDPKMLELSVYDNIPHLLTPVVTDPKKAVVALKWAVREMEDRYKKMSKVGVRNIDGFNARVGEARAKGEVITRTVQTGFDHETGEAIFEREEMDLAPLPYIVVIVDEMADLMLVAGKDIEGAIQRLAQMARAAGIHLIMATQRPSVDVITGTIKANFPTRISFQVTSKIDSRTILGEMGAEQLLGQGDMLYMAGGGRISRVHGPFVSDGEVEHIVSYLKTQGQPQYLDAITTEDEPAEAGEAPAASPGSMDAEESGDLYDRAVAIVLRDKKCSTSYIQRRLSVGYNKAASLVEQMEREGVVSPPSHSGKREILVGGGIDRGAFDIEAAE
ncbi:cell division protein FtsK [Methylocystis heyeri]|uniref:DNA translocase FtsK n=2 Tax=Methylocystis heyeri TaxID=391905 RepID=A0A6B8KLV1_9HYPH|nr:DNA translocase FtsK [Methylocystis heyeri]QGM47733.1 cell division protein FtsK [Methylocystis heyeri]